MDFTKFHCPVCKKEFLENDDVVVCPECGTPHHRECYNLTGKCVNENLHGADGNLKENYKNFETQKSEEIPPSDTQEKVNENGEIPFEINGKPFSEFIKINQVESPLIEGKNAELFESAVGRNKIYYIPKFAFISSFKKKFSFNFIAFFSPLGWAVYRKMYKVAAIIFAAYLLLFGLVFLNVRTNTDLINAAQEFTNEFIENPELYIEFDITDMFTKENSGNLTEAQKNLASVIESKSALSLILFFAYSFLSSGILYAPKIILGCFGNRLYLKKLCKNIDDAELRGFEGDKLKTFLRKKYGTLPFILAILVFFMEFYIVRF